MLYRPPFLHDAQDADHSHWRYWPAYEAAEDYDLFLRASEQGKVDNLDIVGVLYRAHPGSELQRNSLRQAISADLARATHVLRVAGKPDPTDGLLVPPDLEDPVLVALLSSAQMELHHAMSVTLDPDAGAEEVEGALRYFLDARIGKKQARAGRAMVRLIGKRGFDKLGLSLAMKAASLGPRRLVRLLWGSG